MAISLDEVNYTKYSTNYTKNHPPYYTSGADCGEWLLSDIISVVKRSIWSNKYFSKSHDSVDFNKYNDETINSLIYQLSLAA
jgi:hypothetical protein